jgi:hypothetical protein
MAIFCSNAVRSGAATGIVVFLMICLSFWLPSAIALEGTLDWRSVITRAENEAAIANAMSWNVEQGSLDIYGHMPEEDRFVCQYASPAPRNGIRSPRAGDAVFFFHTPGDSDPIKSDICQRLVRESGFTVFSVIFAKSSSPSYFYNPNQHSRFYAFGGSGAFDVIASAWEAVKTRLGLRMSTFFLYGYSAGGIGVQGFSEYHPDLVAGIVSVCGHSFIQKKGAKCPILVIHTYGDTGVTEGDGLALLCRLTGQPCIRLVFDPNWGMLRDGQEYSFHSVNPIVASLSQRFFEAIADARLERQVEKIDFPAICPYIVNLLSPHQVIASRQGASLASVAPLGGQPTLIPSARFYSELIRNAPPTRRMVDSDHGIALISPPSSDSKQEVIIGEWWPSREDQGFRSSDGVQRSNLEIRTECDLRYATERGLFGITSMKSIRELGFVRSQLVKEFPAASSLPLDIIAIDPLNEELKDIQSIPSLHAVVIIISSSTMLHLILNGDLDAFLRRGVKLRIILCAADQHAYDTALSSLSQAARMSIFQPFYWPEKFKHEINDLAVHQRLIEDAYTFLMPPNP